MPDRKGNKDRKRALQKMGIGILIYLILTLIFSVISLILFDWKDYYALIIAVTSGIVDLVLNSIPFFKKGIETIIDSFLDKSQIQRLTEEQKNDIYEYLTAGIDSQKDKLNLRNYLKYYLESPFAGRQAVLSNLDTWLIENSSKPYYLLTGDAGRGKSALLVRWAAHLRETQKDLEIILLPVSIRFGTNQPGDYLRILAEKLAFIHREPIQNRQNVEDLKYWQGTCLDYFKRGVPKNKKLLVLLDGLDESSDPNIAPIWQETLPILEKNLPANIHILLAIRNTASQPKTEAWREHLGLPENQTLPGEKLPDLTRAEITAMLKELGFPLNEIPKRKEVLDELMRLCESDPLLLGHFAEQIRKNFTRSIQLQDLQALSSGYAGAFELWEKHLDLLTSNKDLKKEQVYLFFEVLSLAKAGLSRDDLCQLLSGEDAAFKHGDFIDQIAVVCGRFILGDGNEILYSFQHPKYQYYYRENKMTAPQREAVNQLFIKYGKLTLEKLKNGEIKPEESPTYLVYHYCEHLNNWKTAPPEAYYALLNEDWMKAHSYHDGTENSFLCDVNQVLIIAKEEENLGMVIFAVLCVSSVATLSNNIDKDLLALLLKYGLRDLRQIKALIEKKQRCYEKAEAYLAVALENRDYIDELLVLALNIAQKIDDERDRSRVFSTIAPHLHDPHLQREYLNAAREIEDEGKYAKTLSTIAPYLNTPQLQHDYLYAARKIDDEWGRSIALSAIVLHLNTPQLKIQILEESLNAARKIEDEEERSWAFLAIIPQLNEQESQKQVLQESLSAVRKIDDEEALSWTLSAIAPQINNPELQEDYLNIARKIDDEEYRTEALSAIAPYLNNPELQQGYLNIAKKIDEEYERSNALSAIAPQINNPELQQDYLNTAKKISEVGDRSCALSAIAPQLNNPESQIQVLHESLITARKVEDEENRTSVLSKIAPHFNNPESQQDYLKAATDITYGEFCLDVLTAIAPLLNNTKLQQDYLNISRKIDDEEYRSEALSAIAPYLNNPELQIKVLHESLNSARKISNDRKQSKILSAIAPQLNNPELQILVLQESLKAAQKIDDDKNLSETLSIISLHINNLDLQIKVLQKSLNITENICIEMQRSEALSAIAPQLKSPELQQDYLKIIRKISDERQLSRALIAIAPHLNNPELQNNYLNTTLKIKDERDRASVLSTIAPHLINPELQQDYLKIALKINNEGDRTNALSSIAPHLNNPQQQIQILQKTLYATRKISDGDRRASILSAIAPLINNPEQQQAYLSASREIGKGEHCSRALSAITPHLINLESQMQVLNESFNNAKEIDNERYRSSALSVIAPYLIDFELKQNYIKICGEIDNGWDRSSALSAIAPYLIDFELKQNYIKICGEIDDGWARSSALSAIAPHLNNPELQQNYLSTSRKIDNNGDRACALSAIALHLNNPETQIQVLQDSLIAARKICNEEDRSSTLSAIAPHLHDPHLQREYLNAAWYIIDDNKLSETVNSIYQLLKDKIVLQNIAKDICNYILIKSIFGNINPIYKSIVNRWTELDLPINHLISLFEINQTQSREHLFDLIGVMVPAIVSYENGQETLPQIIHAMQEVSRWWP